MFQILSLLRNRKSIERIVKITDGVYKKTCLWLKKKLKTRYSLLKTRV